MVERLFKEFHGAEVRVAELQQLLLAHFRGARQPELNEVVYPGDGDYSIKLVFRDDRLLDIAAGPKLTAEDVATIRQGIETEILSSPGTKIGSAVFFTSIPVQGHFRYRDVFQLLPVPEGAPQPGFLLADHPFLLEFRFSDSTNWVIRQLRRSVRARELGLLLGGLMEHSVWSVGDSGRYRWVLVAHPPEAEWKTAYLQEAYHCPGITVESDEFSRAEGVAPMLQVAPQEYYTRLGIVSGSQLEVPNNLEESVDRFQSLAAEDQERFLRSCYWFRHAHTVHPLSRSACFAALVCAVEALIPPDNSGTPCPSCLRPVGRGATRQFIDFLDRFAPGTGEMSVNRRSYTASALL